MKIADWHRIMKPGTIIRAIPDPRLSQWVGPAKARIDGYASLESYKEHVRLMQQRAQGGLNDLGGELGDIVRMPLGDRPDRSLTCSRS